MELVLSHRIEHGWDGIWAGVEQLHIRGPLIACLAIWDVGCTGCEHRRKEDHDASNRRNLARIRHDALTVLRFTYIFEGATA